ncbi:hypothetical protein CEUSTIGMA_g1187.t1 [Chlamydomonas eustigma]|uniref:Uncharacterized protein n=1 Tax=Chlamydomonas eustigma TaxID=1157962 RepID=A0A250WSD2_9CHLO|nr:hypothetical protein CEUSTIGMA_g1187.t1 [Chlamydomonas eustigma]|eukprot:GAX73734.1 hypothetical protein CEUSTIGMA_g1187.t1 [Chlamydomonas eustigma]
MPALQKYERLVPPYVFIEGDTCRVQAKKTAEAEVRGSVTDLVTVRPSSLQRDTYTPGLDVVSHGSGIIAQPAVQTEAHIGDEGVSITHSSIGVQLKQDILAALQILEALSAAEGACARHAEFKGVLQQLLDPAEEAGGKLEGGLQGLAVDGATARAILESVLMEVGSHDKGQELGGGWYASIIPIRIPDEPQNELDSSPAECENAVSRNEGCPETKDGTTEEVIMLDDVIMAQEKLPDEAASQAGRQQTACVRVMYAPLDQVSAGGQFACTCVALVVAAWVESHPADSSLFRMSDLSTAACCHGSCGISPEVLSELVLQGCRLWRQSAVIGSQNEDVSRSEVTMRSGRVPEVQTDARGRSSRGSESMLGFHAALDLYNSCCFSPKASTDAATAGQQYMQEQGMVRLWEVQSAYSQVGPMGLTDPGTTFPAFAAAASAAVQMPDGACFKAEARHSAPSLTYLLVAAAHCTVVCFLPDGRVRLINSLGRSLAPSCRSAHVIEFKGVQDFCAVYVGMVLPPGQEAVQVEAHRISVSASAAAGGGEPELLLYLPPE